MSKTVENILILVLTGLIAIVANMIGYKASLVDSAVGMGVMLLIGIAGYLISCVPGLKRVYLIVWVSVLAIYLSSAWFPWSEIIVKTTQKVQFMAIATPLLAYAGLSLGKDMAMFKKLSWRIIPVALAVCAGTFLFAAIIAQFALKWEGAIP